ncbi:MAG TPA: hypothetical protein VMJ10_09140 [Kofleriaceae bacterium]|nr:hypothetical protein [Kofleriaceae bacterium]
MLLPLPATNDDLDAMLAPTAMGNGGQLLPLDIYQNAGEVPYDQLRVVAFRFDPCFGQLGTITDPSTCQNQLRLVFQPIDTDTVDSASPFFVEDAAVHAFYSITRDQLLDAIDEVTAARESDVGDDDLGPLAPHPVVVREGHTGVLAQAFEAMILKYAGAANLVRFTTLEEEVADAGGSNAPIIGAGDFWQLQSFQVAAGAATPLQIPTLPMPTTSMTISAATEPLEATGEPVTSSSDNLMLLADFMQASAAMPAARESAFDAALRVLNPADNSPNTIDCASCHLAQPAIQLVGAQLGMNPAGNSNAFVASPSIPAADLAQTTQLVGSDGVLNIHAFSYRNANPMINQRVIDETAANLAYLATLAR